MRKEKLMFEKFMEPGCTEVALVYAPEDGDWGSTPYGDYQNMRDLCDLFFGDWECEYPDPLRTALYGSRLVMEGHCDWMIGIRVCDDRGFRRPSEWIILDLVEAIQNATANIAFKYARIVVGGDRDLAAALLVRVVGGRLGIIKEKRTKDMSEGNRKAVIEEDLEVNQGVVEVLERLLEKARAGKVTEIGVVTAGPGGYIGGTAIRSEGSDSMELIKGAARLTKMVVDMAEGS